jgi:hypothetical protein
MDNLTIPATDAVVAADDVSDVFYQVVKLDGGGDGLSVPLVAGQQLAVASLPVVIASNQSAIPVSLSGSATAANQATANTSLSTITGHVDGIESALASLAAELGQKTEPADQQHVIVDSSALPSGAATSANQSTANTSLSSIATGVGSKAVSTSDVHAPASNTAAVLTYAAGGAGVSHVIDTVAWSYSGGDPTGGNLKIENGSGQTIFSVDITSQGPGFFPFPRPKKGTANTALIITLAAGGSGITGKINANHWTE